jgi:hypothetical protein
MMIPSGRAEEPRPDARSAFQELSAWIGRRLPKVRSVDTATFIGANGTSCRRQIAAGAGREAQHVARVLERAVAQS